MINLSDEDIYEWAKKKIDLSNINYQWGALADFLKLYQSQPVKRKRGDNLRKKMQRYAVKQGLPIIMTKKRKKIVSNPKKKVTQNQH